MSRGERFRREIPVAVYNPRDACQGKPIFSRQLRFGDILLRIALPDGARTILSRFTTLLYLPPALSYPIAFWVVYTRMITECHTFQVGRTVILCVPVFVVNCEDSRKPYRGEERICHKAMYTAGEPLAIAQ